MKELPKDIGGYQHLEPFVVTEDGDIFVCEGEPISFVQPWGLRVGEYERFLPWCRVYRKMPVPGHEDDKGLGKVHIQRDTLDVLKELHMPMFPVGSFIPQDDKTRKMAPMARGCLFYFPAALFEVAAHSMECDIKHNPLNTDGPTWARNKSPDHADCILRHIIDSGTKGTPNRKYHLRALAWRALALLQEECESEGAKPGISSRF